MKWTHVAISSDFYFDYNFAQAALRERMILSVYSTALDNEVKVQFRNDRIGTWHILNLYTIYNKLVITMNDLFADAQVGDTYALQITTGGSSHVVTGTVKSLVSFENILVPELNTIVAEYIPILPPRRIYIPMWSAASCFLELISITAAYGRFFTYKSRTNYTDTPIWPNTDVARRYGYTYETILMKVVDASDNETQEIMLSPTLCGHKYALVEWTSRLGGRKRMVWEVKGIESKITDSVNLVNVYSDFDAHKGFEQGLTLHMDGLNKYDYWYYSDIIESNDVRVALSEDEISNGSLPETTRVDVQTNNIVQPDANGTYSLDVKVILRKYVYTT